MSTLGTRRPAPCRFVFVALFLATLALLGTAVQTPVRADSEPAVVIYPLVAMGDLGDPGAGGKFATIMSLEIERDGGLIVKPFVPGTERKNYLTAARAVGADYYVTGFLTPIGTEVTLVSQIVSVNSGTVMWSQSAFVKTFGDANAQADAVRRAILAREGRYLAEINAPTAPPNPTPQPGKKANETTGLSLLGHRRGRQRPPTPGPAVSAPATPESGGPVAVATATSPSRVSSPSPTLPPVAVLPQPTPAETAPSVAPAETTTPVQTTPPPAFGRGSGFIAFRKAADRSPRTTALMRRFAPTGGLLASVEGIGDAAHRSLAIDALVRGLHASAAGGPNEIGHASQATVLSHAESVCSRHAGVGLLYVARMQLRPATATGLAVTSLDLTASDCRGVITGESSAVVSDSTVPAAIRRAVSTAIARLGKRPG